MSVNRIFVEKKEGYNVEAKHLLDDIRENLEITNLENIRVLNCYDIEDIDGALLEKACETILSEPPVDHLYKENYPTEAGETAFGIEYLPGQFDQRGDSAFQCLKLLEPEFDGRLKTLKVIVLEGALASKDIYAIKGYLINPVDQREAKLSKPESLEQHIGEVSAVESIAGFTKMEDDQLCELQKTMGLAMSIEDLKHTRSYFQTELREPTETELRVLDTYWSDHCRHTTFLTELTEVEVEKSPLTQPVERAFYSYLDAKKQVEGDKSKDLSLMNIALMGMKKLRQDGHLDDLEITDEINACSVEITVDRDGQDEEWLLMFKNETHNHPTEIEPFGGAATCLGGAIRDPLSGRSYVYQAMRITGSGDPRESIGETLEGKLSQRKIAKGSAKGYSSYGNQIGLATGQVKEYYHEGFKAKHMELGAVIAAAPKQNVQRGSAEAGDLIVLLGGRTGRDGCGGATGSSKEHTVESIDTCGAEVQKGNPPTERKIQRLFRKEAVSSKIKVCNDFGAGGVSVAIGELAEGLLIDLDVVPKKYQGLNGTELAISESQERMAVVIDENDLDFLLEEAHRENLEAVVVAVVTKAPRLVMEWNGQRIVDISRAFLDTNGAKQQAKAAVKAPEDQTYFTSQVEGKEELKDEWKKVLSSLNVCSQKGLIQMFDSTIGGGTVLMPYGGSFARTEEQAMVAKIPVEVGETKTVSVMSHGYNPELSGWSPFHGAYYAIVEAVAKVVAVGGDWRKTRLTLQEYFPRLGQDQERWGLPLGALLGAFKVQMDLSLPAIGGKDSMSGTFHDLDVPPTLVAFGVTTSNADVILSSALKGDDSQLVLIDLPRDEEEMLDTAQLIETFDGVLKCIQDKLVLSARAIGHGGLIEGISKMAFGNSKGVAVENLTAKELYEPKIGSMIIEVNNYKDVEKQLANLPHKVIGAIKEEPFIYINDDVISLEELYLSHEATLEKVYPTKVNEKDNGDINYTELQQAEAVATGKNNIYVCKNKVARPKVILPVFPGTNCEYDMGRAFEKAGAQVEEFVFRNLSAKDIQESIHALSHKINQAQILAFSGGFSAGDEPEGSGKFIASVFRNPEIAEATMKLLKQRDGLAIGICNGFQALVKLGLLPYGEIRPLTDEAPTLTFNQIGKHMSCQVKTQMWSTASPWLQHTKLGDIHSIPISHGEGRFVATEEMLAYLFENNLVATRYVDNQHQPSMIQEHNPNGSYEAIEGIISPDGRVIGKMGHSERVGDHVGINTFGNKEQGLFTSGVDYFK